MNSEILLASYWEHFKAEKDMARYLPPEHPKRVELRKEIDRMLLKMNQPNHAKQLI